MDDFDKWSRGLAEQVGRKLSGGGSHSSAPGSASEQAGDKPAVPVSNGGEIGNAELVTGTAGTGVRTGDEDAYDSFRPGGRDFGQPVKQGSGTGRGQDFETGFDMTL